MPVDDLEAALPALGVTLPSGSKLQGGAVAVDLTVAGQSDKPVISGPIRLSNAKLAGFDLGSKISAIPALAGTQTGGKDTSIQNFSATVRVSPEGVQANAINVDIPALGVVNGSGTVNSSGALDFAMNATLSGGPGMLQKAGSDGQGGGVPFAIQGTASDPKFVPDVKSIAGNAIASKVASAIPERPLAGQVRARRR
jgi:AsmA protein